MEGGPSLEVPSVSDNLLAATAGVIACAQGAAGVICHAAQRLFGSQPTVGNKVREGQSLGPGEGWGNGSWEAGGSRYRTVLYPDETSTAQGSENKQEWGPWPISDPMGPTLTLRLCWVHHGSPWDLTVWSRLHSRKAGRARLGVPLHPAERMEKPSGHWDWPSFVPHVLSRQYVGVCGFAEL